MFDSVKGRSVIVTGASKRIGRGTAISFSADVTKRDEMQAMVDAAVAAFGSIHILCANAGMFPAASLAPSCLATSPPKG